MRKTILIQLLIFTLLVVFSNAIVIETGDSDLRLFCYNASSGNLLGTSANLTCYDSGGNADISNAGMTNQDPGQFNFSFNLVADTYSCLMNCTGEALDSSFYVYVRETPVNTSELPYVTDINDTVTAIRSTDIVTITNNQDTINANIAEVNLTLEVVNATVSENKGLLQGLANLTDVEVWAAVTRRLTHFAFPVNLTTTGVSAVDLQINISHGNGAYNSTAIASISSDDKTDIARDVWDDLINPLANRTVATNISASISTQDKEDIAILVLNTTATNETFTNAEGIGYRLWAIQRFGVE